MDIEEIKQSNEATMQMYNKITPELLDEVLLEMSKKDKWIGNFPDIGPVGCGLYHIGGGAYCNKKGYDQYIEVLESKLKEM